MCQVKNDPDMFFKKFTFPARWLHRAYPVQCFWFFYEVFGHYPLSEREDGALGA